MSESSLIKRRTPKHEVSIPYYIKENIGEKTHNHLLILGAEVKAKQLGMGYSTKKQADTQSFSCFFVYGCEEEDSSMGNSIDVRRARGMEFNIYESSDENVIERVKKLLDYLMPKI